MAERSVCSIDWCDNPAYRRGYCCAHHARLLKWGDPLKGGPMKATYGDPRKWLERAILSDAEECLVWPFATKPNGYGDFRIRGRMMYPHRYVCMSANGDPPDMSMQAGHSCGNRACCNPKHIRWVTRQENEADKRVHGTWEVSRSGLAMGRLPRG